MFGVRVNGLAEVVVKMAVAKVVVRATGGRVTVTSLFGGVDVLEPVIVGVGDIGGDEI